MQAMCRIGSLLLLFFLISGSIESQAQVPSPSSPSSKAPPAPAAGTDPKNYAGLPDQFNTYVISVTDGNWFESEREGQHISVRLYGISCADRRTPVGAAATQDLGRLVFGKIVHVKKVGYSIYGGILGIVSVDDQVKGRTTTTEVNEAMLSRGWAESRNFLDLPEINTLYSKLEAEARQKKVGIWFRAGETGQGK